MKEVTHVFLPSRILLFCLQGHQGETSMALQRIPGLMNLSTTMRQAGSISTSLIASPTNDFPILQAFSF